MTAEVDAADAARLSSALLDRLKTVAPLPDLSDAERDALAARRGTVARRSRAQRTCERARLPTSWLLMVAVTASFPNADQFG